MKIGLLTLPLHYNYGGILQTYALQKVLQNMGHDVWIIKRESKKSVGIRKLVKLVKRKIKYLFKKNKHSISKTSQEKQKILAAYTSRFVQAHFPCSTEKITKNKEFCCLSKYKFDAYVVGSDQVWRPQYLPCLTNYFLDFIEKERKIKRIAYAASFGVSTWEYTKKQTRDCARLAKKFDAISVREDSGIDLCRTNFGVAAVHVLDPTMLLDVKDYVQLAGDEKRSSDNLMTYILDETDETRKIIKDVTELLKLAPFSVMPKRRLSEKPRPEIDDCIYPPVTKFLRGFIDAKFVITDSFHGCAFSILFNKPFLIIGNQQRGMSRIDSLTKLFELEDRLINISELKYKEVCFEAIDWLKVNATLMTRREESIRFLSENLVD